MNTYIGFLRGINVGGHNKLPMAEFREVLAGLALSSVKTYIQSGNVVFQSERTDTEAMATEIRAAIEKSHGFAPQTFILEASQLAEAMVANPFPEGEDEPKTLHLFFLDSEPESPDFEKLDSLKAESERYKLTKNVFYLHTPDGMARSKLGAGVEKVLKDVSVTARNWRTATKVMAMANELDSTNA